MERIISLLGACMLFAQGCSPGTKEAINEQEKKVISKAVEERVAEYVDAMKKLDIEKMLDFWADTENFVKTGDGTLVTGYKKFAAQQREKMSKIESVNYVNTINPHIYVLAKDAASYSFEFEWSMVNKTGQTLKSKGSWTYVFKKFDKWKVVHSAGAHINE